jgi:hypothetical protein
MQPTTAPVPTTVAGAPVPIEATGGTPEAVFRAFQAQARELRNQSDRLERRHDEIAREIRNTPLTEGAIRKGLETRLAEVDGRIVDLEKQIGGADAQVARAAAIPGAVQPDRPPPRNGPPDEVFIIPVVFIMFVLFPLTIAFARRLWRRGAVAVSAIPTELMERLGRLETAVDSVALEVERIGEGQRFVSRLFAEGGARHLGAGAAQPVEAAAREAVPVGAAQGRTE